MTTNESGEREPANSIELEVAHAVSAFVEAQDTDPAVAPEAFAPRDSTAAAKYWRAVEGLQVIIGEVDKPNQNDDWTVTKPPSGRDFDACPEHIGKFKVLDVLGEGGMGTVYLAEQTEPIYRRVALKVIKLGMDTKQVIARFEAERQALAMMNHPHVARIFDAGATEGGRPYFVMEHVGGFPITKYCDEHRLNTEQRLTLFTQVCQAVQHAHQKGIIHRDIKPSNVLVASEDGNGQAVPKVIDFGVAKATGRHLTERTLFTAQDHVVGTPAYMSPEQAEGGALDIDTRTDVYSLGVLLYELLVGVLPFDPESLRAGGLDNVRRIVREEEPQKPSTRLSALGDDSGTVAEHRGTDIRSLAKQLRGDLDWIIMKAMEKDRARRYETASKLADDILHHLNHMPVEAGPPSKVYRLKKFIRRNKGAVAAVVAVFAVLSAGVVTATELYLRAESQRQRAVRAEQEQSRERERAEMARDDSDAVVAFLSNMLAAIKPEEQGKDVTVRQVLDEAARTIGAEFAGKPLIEARLHHTIGNSFHALGLFDAAEQHATAAASVRRRELGVRHPDTLRSINLLTAVLLGQGKFAESGDAFRRTYEIQRRVLGEEHPDTLGAMENLAATLVSEGKYAEAETLLHKTLEIQRRVLGDEHLDTLQSMNDLALAVYGQGKYAEAETLFRQNLEAQRRALGDEHPTALRSMNNLALALYNQGKSAEAETLQRKTLEIKRRVLGEEHAETLRSMNNLALALCDQGKYADAEALHRRTLDIQRRVLGEEHPNTLSSMDSLATVLHEQGKFVEADTLYRHTLEARRRILGDEHPDTLASMNNLANALSALGKYKEAESLRRRTVEMGRRVLGENHPTTLMFMSNLGSLLRDQGTYGEAESLHRESLEMQRRLLGDEHPDTLSTMEELAGTLCAQGKHAEAKRLYRRTLDIQRRVLGERHPDLAYSLVGLAEALIQTGAPQEAKRLLDETLRIQIEALPDSHWRVACTRSVMGECLTGLGRYTEAEPVLLKAHARIITTQSKDGCDSRKSFERIVRLYEAWDTVEPGKGYSEKAAEWRARRRE